MITNTLKWKHVSLALLLSLATLISACGGDSDPPPAADTLYFVHTDHLGTPQVITDTDQKTVWEGRSLPFGETDIITHEIAFNGRFPGQYYDQESGLHYNYFRDYDPALGRYVQSDPIGLGGGLNTYGYVYQNPVRYTDPTGEATVLEGAAALGAASALYCLLNPVHCQEIGKACSSVWNAWNESTEDDWEERSEDPNKIKETYPTLEAAVGSVNPLDDIEYEGKTKDQGLREQGFTEKYTGVDSDGTYQTAFHNPTTGEWTGGHESSKNDKYW